MMGRARRIRTAVVPTTVEASAVRLRSPVAVFVCLLLVVVMWVPSPPEAEAQAVTTDPCPAGGGSDARWALSTTTFDTAFYRHAVVGNGYLSQRVPPTGMGYVATGEPTGWPLYTPR